ncbi:MAG: hypothetical protein AAGA68_19555 [Pseudomonadota bacterium]
MAHTADANDVFLLESAGSSGGDGTPGFVLNGTDAQGAAGSKLAELGDIHGDGVDAFGGAGDGQGHRHHLTWRAG